MNDTIILLAAIGVSALVGAFIGFTFSKLKSKGEKSTLEERQNQLNKTIEELKKRDDKWFEEQQPSFGWTNEYCWFHVMEHQSSHLGQILFLAKRIPPEAKLELPENIKD